MAEHNRNRPFNEDWDRDRNRGGQRYGNYGGAYSSDYGSPYGGGYEQSSHRPASNRLSDSEWDRDEYREGHLWDREHYLGDYPHDSRSGRGSTYGAGVSRSNYDAEGRSRSYHSSSDDRRRGDRDRDRDWWDRGRDEVASWFGDDDAERRRRRDEQRAGAVHRGKGPKGYHRSEERIREDAYDRLTEDGYVDASNIQVQLEGDDVVLSGTVHSREEKRRAEDLVERVSGVRNVENRLRIERD